ncbi:hypothetical protein N1F89_18800 [Aquibium sp. A9E412]|uniref:hypothetical protein n=1 Tax=Aquibium sp. A9E412 TaxID=2976767 RepID=UPI0025B1794A|nr:hypothetical protein [Aquibium sp. A9E412]MDN2568278.1 hypothetical protein [Aquibium sp. A9E412]
MKRALLAALLPTAIAAAGSAAPAAADERDARFFKSVEGEWSGPGEIVAGKYKGTKFVCRFTGATPDDKVGMSLDGGCRVGMFTQKMSAVIERRGRHYRGTFMDGAEGKGLDIVAGNVSDEKVIFSLNRKTLNGAMLARLPDDDTMHVTVSVKVADDMVPVIGVNLKRLDSRKVGALRER